MAKLKLIDIRCVKNGEVGGDEPYLKVRGNKVWSGNDIKTGMAISMRSIQPITFKDEISVELFEKDTFSDDRLGSGTITSDMVGQGQQEINFDEGSGKYQLIFEVLEG